MGSGDEEGPTLTDAKSRTRPHTRRSRRRAPLAGALCLLVAMLVAPSGAQAGEFDHLLAPESTCPGQTNPNLKRKKQVRALVCMHNYTRAVLGLPRAKSVKKLRRSARKKAKDVRRCQQLSHTACGRGVFYWFRRVGYLKRGRGGGENLALGSGWGGTARSTLEGWLSSPTHRKVILKRKFKRLGVGMVRGKYQGYRGVRFWVAHVGTRRG